MKVEQICNIINEVMGQHFSIKRPANCVDLAENLIWEVGVYFPEDNAPLYMRMNMLAIDMIMKGEY